MIKLYKNTKSNIGRGVVVTCYGKPCKRRIKAVAPGFVDASGKRTLVDVTRRRTTRYTWLGELVALDQVWDNWHAWMRDAVKRIEQEMELLLTDPGKICSERHCDAAGVLDAYKRRMRERDHWLVQLARLDAVTEKRRRDRKLMRRTEKENEHAKELRRVFDGELTSKPEAPDEA